MRFKEASPRTANGVYLISEETGGPSRLAELVKRSFTRLLTPDEIAEAERHVERASDSAELCESGCGSSAVADTRLCRSHCFQTIRRES